MSEDILTILFTDVEASTDLRTRLGDEVANERLDKVKAAVEEEIARAGGRVVKHLGDGTLAAFTSPRRAVSCAAAVQDSVAELNRAIPDDPLRIRVGLNSGEVTVADDDVQGEAVHAAARIAALARGGQILVSSVVKDLAGTLPGVTFASAGRHSLRGFEQEWALHEVVVERKPPAMLAAQTPFVGRTAEVDQLRKHLESCLRGRGTVVLIGGEPGVGKTRLAEETAAIARGHRVASFTGRCYEMQGGPPYTPFVEMLEATARAVPDDVFKDLLGDSAAEIARLLPEVNRLFPELPTPLDLPAEQARRYTFNSITRYLLRAAAMTPVLLIFDDLHWADDATLALLEHLAVNLRDAPVLLLGTYRDVELSASRPLARTLEELVRRRLAHRLSLKRFSVDDVAAMLHRLSGSAPPRAFVEAIYAETEGNAFFVEEVFRHLFEEGRLLDPSGGWRFDVELADVDVPESVRLVIGRRLERLGDTATKALTAAAVIGRVFDFDVLASVSETRDDDLLDAVEEAERARLVASRAEGRRVRFEFVHELIRQTLLADLSLPRRQRLHLRVADAIEKSATNPEERSPDLAHHLFQAGATADAARTVRYLVLAGDRAMASAAPEDALRNFDDALLLLEDDPEERARVLYRIGRARRILRQWPEAMAAWREALETFERLGNARDAARTCLLIADRNTQFGNWQEAVDVAERGLGVVQPDDPMRAQLLALQAIGYSWLEDHAAALGSLQESEGAARDTNDFRARAAVASARCVHHWCFGEFLDAINAGRAAADLLRGTTAQWGLATVLSFLQFSMGVAGSLEGFEEVTAELVPLARRLEHPTGLTMTRRWTYLFALHHDADLDAALAAMSSDLEFTDSIAIPWGADVATMTGLVERMRGNWDAALEHFAEGDRRAYPGAFNGANFGFHLLHKAYVAPDEMSELYRRADERMPAGDRPATWGSWNVLATVVEARAVTDEWDVVAALYPLLVRALDQGVRTRAYVTLPIAALAAIGALAAGKPEEATRHYEDARAYDEAVNVPWWRAETNRLYALALLSCAPGTDAELAGGLLEEARGIYERMNAPRHVELTRALIERATRPPTADATTRPASLFRHEGEFWTIGHAERPVRLRHTVGLSHIARLLAHPGHEIAAAELASADGAAGFIDRDAGPVLDDDAKRAYRQRLGDLDEELQEAIAWADEGRAAKARAEIDALTAELSRAVGLGGRDRKAGSASEKARVNVTKAIKAALKKIEGADPALGRHLAATIRTGTYCVYDPEGDGAPRWDLGS